LRPKIVKSQEIDRRKKTTRKEGGVSSTNGEFRGYLGETLMRQSERKKGQFKSDLRTEVKGLQNEK